MKINVQKDSYFRAGAGVILFDEKNNVALFERIDILNNFQFSQGGLDANEDPQEGAVRELFEETGVSEQEMTIVGEFPHWASYEASPHKPKTPDYRGQTQKWFYARINTGVEIDVTTAKDKEFVSHKWVPISQALAEIIEFKRDMFMPVLKYLEKEIMNK